MKVGDLVRNKNSERGAIGIILKWYTFDPETNPYTCPIVSWADGRTASIQTNLLEVISACRHYC